MTLHSVHELVRLTFLPNVAIFRLAAFILAKKAVQITDDLFAEEAIEFKTRNKEAPFFLYWSMVIPHANNERTRALTNGAHVPDFGPNADEDWPEPDNGQAAMISRMVGYVGRMLSTLRELGLAENTLVIFTSDNGPHNESNHNLERFRPSGPLTGIKRSLTDGGMRVPMIAWWRGPDAPVVLYDLKNDIAERTNVSERPPETATKISDYLKSASLDWKPKW